MEVKKVLLFSATNSYRYQVPTFSNGSFLVEELPQLPDCIVIRRTDLHIVMHNQYPIFNCSRFGEKENEPINHEQVNLVEADENSIRPDIR